MATTLSMVRKMLVNRESRLSKSAVLSASYTQNNTIESQYIAISKISIVSVGKISESLTKKPTTDAIELQNGH